VRAVVLRDQLSPEIRDALVGPWVTVFGDPFAPPVTLAERRGR